MAGFLDAKERILDVVLTDRGRELLSQNLLNFEYYVFSDDGIDYAAALTASLTTTGSLDEHIRRTPAFEAEQYKTFEGRRDLSSFLYTVPEGQQTLPQFVTNFDSSPDITTKRSYFLDLLSLSAKKVNRTTTPVSVVMRGTIPQNTRANDVASYVLEQRIRNSRSRLLEGKNVVGDPIGENDILLNSSTTLDTETGLTSPVLASQRRLQVGEEVLSAKKEVEVVSGLGRTKIDFVLKSSEGEVFSPSGFLVEVFESGSDGRLIQLHEEDVVDVLEDEILRRGFSKELFLDVDASNKEIISDLERVARQQTRRRDLEFRRLQKNLQRKVRKIE